MANEREDVERELRQLRLMLDRLRRFRDGELSIGPVINDLEALLEELQITDETFRDEFVEGWSMLEIPYAVALDRLTPIPDADDATVAEGVGLMERLVLGRLEVLDP